jgi:predicted enzyme related to lactoylglutathione lyase
MHFEIQADDIVRATNFYKKIFGWKIDQAMTAEKGGMDYWTIVTGEKGEPGINGGLYVRPSDRKLETYDCTITVENIDKAIADIKKNGGKITRDKTEMKGLGFFARAEDTEGNTFGLMQPTDWKP